VTDSQINLEFENRLKKNQKKLKGYLKQENTTAYRLYDRDIPDYPYIVDVYGDYVIVYERGLADVDEALREKHLRDVTQAIINLFIGNEKKIIFKERKERSGKSQYSKINEKKEEVVVKEGDLQFLINPHDYLDTGLFLDHRVLRKKLSKISRGKKVLNLFSYTGAVSVAAAFGGGNVTSVDKSSTYMEWAKRNFTKNGLMLDFHDFIVNDVILFLKNESRKFDLIFLDPPTFSNESKKNLLFDVEKDQVEIVNSCMKLLSSDGTLYFSNNKRSFKLDPSILEKYKVKDISEWSIPTDFRDKKIHRLYLLQQHKSMGV